MINDEDNCLFIEPSKEENIKKVVCDCDGNKSSILNGFNFNFIKSCWDVVEIDIIKVIHEFHANGRFSRRTNASFFTIIPKKDDPLALEI